MLSLHNKTGDKTFTPVNSPNKVNRMRRNALVLMALIVAALCGPLHGSARGAEQPDPPPGTIRGGNK